MKKYCILSVIFIYNFSFSQQLDPLLTEDYLAQQQWVDSVYNNMSLKEKVGQLFMERVYSKYDKANLEAVKKRITENHIGGLIYSLGGPVRQANLNNELQQMSKIPLLVGMDAEWGLNMRLDSTYAFPYNMALGAVKDNDLIEKTGRYLGLHCKRLGVHINFAPDIDINTNPKNPIIGNRSFGEDPQNVAAKAIAFTEGMQGVGVLACGKHFPGHGDTDSDSHKTLPTINFTAQRLDSVELYPYKKLFGVGLASVMIAHLNVPSLESREGFPSSISKKIVTNLLKERLGYNGLIFTDALEMKGVSNFSEPGEVDLAAFLAGNDMLLISEDVPKAASKIMEAYQNNIISEARLAHSVKKILKAKYKVGLHKPEAIELDNLVADLNTIKDQLLSEKLFENAITLAKNSNDLLPIKNLKTAKIAYLKMGDDEGTTFFNMLGKYTQVDEVTGDNLNELITKLTPYNHVIIGLHKSNDNPWKDHKFTEQEKVWLYELSRRFNVILTIFTKPYALNDLLTTTNIESVVVSYQNSIISQQKTAQLLFGALPFKGQLSVSAGTDFPVGTSIETTAVNRLTYGLPESVGINSLAFNKIDSTAQSIVDNEMAPGLQLLIARKGKVIYEKTFGYLTYDKKERVQTTDIYDVASMTKILATLPMIMKLVEAEKINIDTPLRKLSKDLKKSNKDTLTIKEVLSHHGRLKPWIPFYLRTLDSSSGKLLANYYQREKSRQFSIHVADNLYLRTDFKDSIKQLVLDSGLRNRAEYKYSDLPYYILKEYIENEYGVGLDQLVQDNYYQAIGANFTTYNPLEKFKKEHIAPSEDDTYFRRQHIRGYVHDMGAAMQDGVGGHAGLFSNANDVAKLMQMYLQNGTYGGQEFLKPQTIATFNTCYFCKDDNRRGVGFDKPQLEGTGSTCGCVSDKSFGHSGFTGTYTWADPVEEIVYVFLSNRTFPTMTNRKLIKENVRTAIQQIIYDAIVE